MKLAASITVLATVGFFVVSTMMPTKALAFEDVAEAILDIDNVSFEVTSTISMDIGATRPQVATVTSSTTMDLPSKVRSEGDIITFIADLSSDQVLVINALKYEAVLYDNASLVMPAESWSNTMLIKIQKQLQLVKEQDNLDGIKYKALGQKKINGQQATGFRITDPDSLRILGGNSLNTADIWSDSETGLPVELTFSYNKNQDNERIIVYHNFKYDQKLDPELFSLKPPANCRFSRKDAAKFDKEDFASESVFRTR